MKDGPVPPLDREWSRFEAAYRGRIAAAAIKLAFKGFKHDRAIQSISQQREERIKAHIFVSLSMTLSAQTAPRITDRRAMGGRVEAERPLSILNNCLTEEPN